MIENTNEHKNRLLKIKAIKNIKDLNQTQRHILVIQESLNFFEEFGYDIEVLLYYGIALRMNGFYEKAIDIFNKMINLQKEEENNTYYNSARIELFKAYYMINDFEKAYELWDFTKTRLRHQTEKHIYYLDLILKIRLGLEHDEVNEKNMHIINHNSNFALEHINEHMNDFSTDIKINEIYELVIKHLENSKIFPLFSVNDVYLFKFPNIGQNGENVLKVITNKGTNEIITMYPSEIEKSYQEKINCTDFLNDNLYEEYICKNIGKTKRLSQIDRFKSRFNNIASKK